MAGVTLLAIRLGWATDGGVVTWCCARPTSFVQHAVRIGFPALQASSVHDILVGQEWPSSKDTTVPGVIRWDHRAVAVSNLFHGQIDKSFLLNSNLSLNITNCTKCPASSDSPLILSIFRRDKLCRQKGTKQRKAQYFLSQKSLQQVMSIQKPHIYTYIYIHRTFTLVTAPCSLQSFDTRRDKPVRSQNSKQG